MDNSQGQTLEEYEQIQFWNIHYHKLGLMIQAMQQTGYHKWGFCLYRCTYSDDEAWLRYVEHMRKRIIDSLELRDQRYLLEKYLDIQIIEDRDKLDNAKKDFVRAHFAEQAEGDRQRLGTASIYAMRMPRFNFCLYVDQACLDTLLAREKWERENQEGQRRPFVVCAIIDTDCEPGGEGLDGYESVEGCTRYFPGWMYCAVPVSYTHLTLPTSVLMCRSRWSPYH